MGEAAPRPKRKLLSVVLAVVAGGAFLYFVWPTPYEYTRKAPLIWRVNRFTGVREVSSGSGWHALDANQTQDLPTSEISSIKELEVLEPVPPETLPKDFFDKGKNAFADLVPKTACRVRFYNGSRWSIHDLTVVVSKFADGTGSVLVEEDRVKVDHLVNEMVDDGKADSEIRATVLKYIKDHGVAPSVLAGKPLWSRRYKFVPTGVSVCAPLSVAIFEADLGVNWPQIHTVMKFEPVSAQGTLPQP